MFFAARRAAGRSLRGQVAELLNAPLHRHRPPRRKAPPVAPGIGAQVRPEYAHSATKEPSSKEIALTKLALALALWNSGQHGDRARALGQQRPRSLRRD